MRLLNNNSSARMSSFQSSQISSPRFEHGVTRYHNGTLRLSSPAPQQQWRPSRVYVCTGNKTTHMHWLKMPRPWLCECIAVVICHVVQAAKAPHFLVCRHIGVLPALGISAEAGKVVLKILCSRGGGGGGEGQGARNAGGGHYSLRVFKG